MAVADASLSTVIDSTVFGFSEARNEVEPVLVLLLIGKPSTTISGSLLAKREAPPRIRIVELDPGAPLVLIVRPATLPLRRFSVVTMAPLLKSLAVTVVTAPVRSFLRTVP